MTILSVAQDVSLAVGIARPQTIFASTAREMQEMQAVANEAAAVISDAHDWQKLLAVQTVTGNGVTEAHDLPSNYRRMLQVSELWLSRTQSNAAHFVALNDWLALDFTPAPPIEGVWSIFGGQIHIRPILTAGETARFFYMKDTLVSDGKQKFDNDADAFALDERLLRLCMIQLWKQQKGQDFTAELSDYEMTLMRAIRFDSGSMPKLTGNTRSRYSPSNVWAGTVSG